eukprot:TRINITY_DN36776_c0_g1_i1.p1 TRINITY_DN36776_c0_g1~~TRINITY_DN36776_c0_g1_i1.p1  ORF type:complete len:384 (+),score=82.43 TRINITY_DN36776_c0_g1_i1:84-1235(+)
MYGEHGYQQVDQPAEAPPLFQDLQRVAAEFLGPSALWKLGAVCLAFFAAVVAFSVHAVAPLTYGVRYNFFYKSADTDNVFGPGRYLIGPWSTFLVFPSSVQTVEFTSEPMLDKGGVRYPSLHTRTREGLALHLQVSLQYQLEEDKVPKLYAEFNQNYEQVYISIIRDTLIRTAADYEAIQLWENRRLVGDRMQTLVNESLSKVYARCWGLQLMVIDLPIKFENSIVATQVQSQKVSTEQFAQQATQVQAKTKVIEAEFARRVKVIKAGGHANFTVVTKTARAQAKQKVLDTEAQVLETVRKQLGLKAPDLVEYQRFSAMKVMEDATLFYGFGEGTQVFMQSFHEEPVVGESRRLSAGEGDVDAGDADKEEQPGSERRLGNTEL